MERVKGLMLVCYLQATGPEAPGMRGERSSGSAGLSDRESPGSRNTPPAPAEPLAARSRIRAKSPEGLRALDRAAARVQAVSRRGVSGVCRGHGRKELLPVMISSMAPSFPSYTCLLSFTCRRLNSAINSCCCLFDLWEGDWGERTGRD